MYIGGKLEVQIGIFHCSLLFCMLPWDQYIALNVCLYQWQEDTRQKLVNSDNKVRQLEGQIHQEQQAFASTNKVSFLVPTSVDILSAI